MNRSTVGTGTLVDQACWGGFTESNFQGPMNGTDDNIKCQDGFRIVWNFFWRVEAAFTFVIPSQ